MGFKNTMYLSPKELAPILDQGKGTITRPIPADLLHIEKLPGENGPSAWTVERYLKNGRAYQQCTRLSPFGRDVYKYLWLKVKGARAAHHFTVESFEVARRKGVWVWLIKVTR